MHVTLSPDAIRLAVEHLPAPSTVADTFAYRELIAAWALADQPEPAPISIEEPVIVEPAPPLVLVNPPAKPKVHRERMSGTQRPRRMFGKVERAWYASNGYRIVAERYGVGVCAVLDIGHTVQRGVWLSQQEYRNVRDELRAQGRATEDAPTSAVGGEK